MVTDTGFYGVGMDSGSRPEITRDLAGMTIERTYVKCHSGRSDRRERRPGIQRSSRHSGLDPESRKQKIDSG